MLPLNNQIEPVKTNSSLENKPLKNNLPLQEEQLALFLQTQEKLKQSEKALSERTLECTQLNIKLQSQNQRIVELTEKLIAYEREKKEKDSKQSFIPGGIEIEQLEEEIKEQPELKALIENLQKEGFSFEGVLQKGIPIVIFAEFNDFLQLTDLLEPIKDLVTFNLPFNLKDNNKIYQKQLNSLNFDKGLVYLSSASDALIKEISQKEHNIRHLTSSLLIEIDAALKKEKIPLLKYLKINLHLSPLHKKLDNLVKNKPLDINAIKKEIALVEKACVHINQEVASQFKKSTDPIKSTINEIEKYINITNTKLEQEFSNTVNYIAKKKEDQIQIFIFSPSQNAINLCKQKNFSIISYKNPEKNYSWLDKRLTDRLEPAN